jgi:hypothetical protein
VRKTWYRGGRDWLGIGAALHQVWFVCCLWSLGLCGLAGGGIFFRSGAGGRGGRSGVVSLYCLLWPLLSSRMGQSLLEKHLHQEACKEGGAYPMFLRMCAYICCCAG